MAAEHADAVSTSSWKGDLPAVAPYRPTAELAIAAVGFAEESLSEATRRAYASDVRQFRRWLAGYTDGELGNSSVLERVVTAPVGPATVVEYLTEKALALTPAGEWRYAPSSMTRWLSAITRDHIEQGLPSPCTHPTVLAVLAGIRREHARPRRQSAPLLLDGLRKAVLATDVTSFPGVWPAPATSPSWCWGSRVRSVVRSCPR